MTATSRQIIARTTLQGLGYPKPGASALVGNFSQEVGVNLQSGYLPTSQLDHGSQCLPQWRLGRLTAFENYCAAKSLHTGAMESQLRYVAVELARDYPALDKALRDPKGDIASLTARVCWEYERPAQSAANLANRVKQAQATYAAPDLKTAAAGARQTADAHQAGSLFFGAGAAIISFLHLSLWIVVPVVLLLLAVIIFNAVKASQQNAHADALDAAVADMQAKAKATAAAQAASTAAQTAASAAIAEQEKKIAAAKAVMSATPRFDAIVNAINAAAAPAPAAIQNPKG